MPKRYYSYLIVSFILMMLIPNVQSSAQNMNQVGYLPKSEKRVFLTKEYQGKDFSISNKKGEQILSGKITKAKYW